MKQLAHIVAALFVIGGMLLFALPESTFPEFYYPFYMGAMALIAAGLIALVGILASRVHRRWSNVLLAGQAVLTIALVLNALGALGLYRLSLVGFQYDGLVHATNCALFGAVLYRARSTWRPGESAWRSILWTVGVIIVSGVLWEVWEASSDFALGSTSFGDCGENVVEDTTHDLVFNTVGGLLGAILASLKSEQ